MLSIFFVKKVPAPQPQFPEFDTSDPATQLAGVATLGATLFAGYNCLTGNCNIRVRPNLGLNYDPKTGRLAPALGANVQVILFYFLTNISLYRLPYIGR